ncbi:MAG TPA: hypothetical protein DCP68_09010 [Ruminococcus sp.]|nr:hypothetical protein [Ruminococcus sp.]
MTVQNAAAVAAPPKPSVTPVTPAVPQSVPVPAQPDAEQAATPKTRKFVIKEKEKVKKLFVIAAASVVLLLIACFSLWYYSYSHFNMFGKPIDIYAEEVDFNGREIPDLDSLKSYLRRFKNLKVANLGSYAVEAEQSIAFRQAFPDTELIYNTVVNIDGRNYRTDIETLDVSGCGIRDTKAFIEKLGYLPNLKTVIFGEQAIPETEKNILINAYPEIDFEVLGTYEIYGKQVLENVETLDLRDVKLDAALFDQLALLPQLKEVDLHNQPLSIADRIALTNEFPEVSFGWTVKYDGEEYDSAIPELDLTGKKLTEDDLPALKEAIEQFPLLEKVILCDCGLSNDRLTQFQKEIGDKVRVVWRVYIGSQWSLRTDAVAFSVLIVNYKHIRMTSDNLEVLKYCPDLLALDLGHQALTDISPIAEYLPDLRLLIIADNRVYDLSPLEKLKHLHYLEIFVNRVSDISPLAKLHELVDVNISYNAISDVTPLLNSPMMQRIWLESTYVGYKGLSQLREAYPDAKIVNVGSGSVDQGWRWGNPRYEQMMDMWFHDYYGDEFQKYDDLAVELGLRDDE